MRQLPFPLRHAALLLPLLVALGASAGPRLARYPGGLGFHGPTDPQVTALWWNVAAIGELPGTHIHLSASPILLDQQMTLRSGAQESSLDLQPDLFAGMTTDFGSEHVRFGFAYHTPFRDRGTLAGASTLALGDDGPFRYHRLETRLKEHYFSPAGTYRINGSVSFGVGMNIVYSTARLALDRCLGLDQGLSSCSDPNLDERLDVGGSALSVGFQAGFLWRIRGRVTIGGAFLLRPGLSTITVDEYGSAERNARLSRGNGSVQEGFGQIRYTLPDIVHLGARWLVTDRIEAAATFRYVDWGQRGEPIRILLSFPRPMAGTPSPPSQIPLYRGFRDSFSLEARGAYCVALPLVPEGRCRFRLGLLAAIDTGSYDEQAVHADAIDGPTLEAGVIFEWRATKHIRLTGGGTYAVMMGRNVTDSAFRTDFATGCARAIYAAPACREAEMGRGLPSADGQYGLHAYTASLGLAFDWWPE